MVTNLKKSLGFSRAGLEVKIESFFWEIYMPKGLSSALFDESQVTLGGSINAVRNLLPDSNLLRTAFGAIALRSMSNAADTPLWMRQEGIRLYSAALEQMSKELASSSRKHNALAILGAARIFTFYEALFGYDLKCHATQQLSWLTHQAGDLAIVLSKDPSFYATGPAHRLFVDGRMQYALYAIKTRQKCVLANSAWMCDPWTHHKKTPKDLLVDILFEFGSIYAEIDSRILSANLETKAKSQAYLEICMKMVIKNLSLWNERFRDDVCIFEKDWESPKNLPVKEITAAHVMTLYWAICILAHDANRTIFGGGPTGLEIHPRDCCQGIIRCIPKFLHSSTGTFRQHLIPFPLMTAMSYLIATETDGLAEETKYVLSISQAPELASVFHFMASLKGSSYIEMLQARVNDPAIS
ncbi:uncharacterized protein N7483_002990 [Penicillium malachiteum]|uniref:uncharacterized protein n=1 Tax=Penicillium malachiteum TaxID=1324776 RepID=UPI0025485F10|nr:uncharacterized protein N7483_002990 [Penicillium malachiteum]KAJ5737865.1 hypothetical protein N7483_002990 [Penicillium malachiteum]